MTLPKKTSRPISIDGTDYRWMVTAKDESTLTLNVENLATKAMMRTTFAQEMDTDGIYENLAITPGAVEKFIRGHVGEK